MSGELVLIVEDDAKNLELMRDVLQVKGYRTLEASSAAAATALATAHLPALVLMDVRLPDLDGITALRRLRAEPALVATPIVAVTAFAMRDDRERLLAAGFDGYLSKPIELQTFLCEVQRHVRPTGEASPAGPLDPEGG